MKKLYPEPWKRSDSSFYQFWFTDKSAKRHKITTGEILKEEARKKIREYVDQRRCNKTVLTFQEYSEPYFVWQTCPRVARLLEEGKMIGKTHVGKSRRWLEIHVFTDLIFSMLPMNEVKRGDILDFRRRLREKDNAPGINTINKAVATIKTIVSEASFRGDINTNPGTGIGGINYEKAKRGVLSIEEVKMFLHKRPGDMKKNKLVDLVISTLLLAGMRCGELRGLRWNAVNLETGRTNIIEAFKDNKSIGGPKWGKCRDIILPRILLERIRAWRLVTPYLKPENHIFCDLDCKPIGQTWIANNMRRVLQAAEDSKELGFKIQGRWLTPHALRHTVNTHLLASGVPPLLVQAYLGWSSLEYRVLTRVQAAYTELRLFRLEDVSEKLDELFGEKEEKKELNAEKIS